MAKYLLPIKVAAWLGVMNKPAPRPVEQLSLWQHDVFTLDVMVFGHILEQPLTVVVMPAMVVDVDFWNKEQKLWICFQ